MTLRNVLFASTLLALIVGASLRPSSLDAQTLPDGQRKQMQAVRVNGVPSPRLDGLLEDPAWQEAIFVSDFLQKEPDEGGTPQDSTRVAVIYDDEALYIGARMYSNAPKDITIDVNRRDEPGNAEQIILSLDTYLDRRTSYDFCVSSAGVRMDRYHAEDNEHESDRSYNPVWEGRAHIDSLGWSAEMRIPFSQLRFNNADEQVWGINWNRWIPARREDVFWIYTPRQETGWASRFGDLKGIQGIRPSRRLELLPYVASDGRFEDVDAGNPFRDGSDLSGRIGGDLKMGLGTNLTLDATINPDFGQVEADPAEVNLTAFETYFEDRRPFFVEGSQLFEIDGPTYFYSRRIGSQPHGGTESSYQRLYVDAGFVNEPQNTTIPAAAKITGRLSSGLSLATLFAVTGREYAETYDAETKERTKVEIEPPTGFGVVRLQQEFGEDASTAGLILTGMKRQFSDDEDLPLSGELHKDATSGGGDWNLRFRGGAYEVRGWAGFSHIRGDTASILHSQRSSARYYQRPDADYVTLDPTRTSLSGYTGALRINKRSGAHWLWGTGASVESPGYELNDVGILSSADDIDAWANLQYRETNPGRLFRNYSVGSYVGRGWDYGGIHQYTQFELSANGTFHNYMSAYVSTSASPRGFNDSFTRGGPLMRSSSNWNVNTGLTSNFSARYRWGIDGFYARNELGGWGAGIDAEVAVRGTRWELGIEPGYERITTSRQYVETIDTAGGGAETYDSRYIFAWIDRSAVAAEIRVNYFFTPDLSLEVYAEPFAASGKYYDFGELAAARTQDIRVYTDEEITSEDGRHTVEDADGTFSFTRRDFGYLSFRSNVVVRWEFRAGSTLFLVWQQNREDEDRPGELVRPRSLWKSFSGDGSNFVAVKISYWLPIS